jgi:uncharacterized protein YodC (DUF2158 family)
MATFKKGDVVTLRGVIPTGPVTKMRMNDDGEVSYLIEWSDENGVVQHRWFTESQLVGA